MLMATRLLLDRDCPQCGWPEVRVVRYDDGSGMYECTSRGCDWEHVGYWEGASRPARECAGCSESDDTVADRPVQKGHAAPLCARCGEDPEVLRGLAEAPWPLRSSRRGVPDPVLAW